MIEKFGDYTSPIDPIEESAKLDQEWFEKHEEGFKTLDSNKIIDIYRKYYDLTCKLISQCLGYFLRKEDITNGVMQDVDTLAEKMNDVARDNKERDIKLVEIYEDRLASSLIRVFTNRDMKISNEQEDQFQDGIDLFIEALKKELSNNNG